jgi:hypothetical protein
MFQIDDLLLLAIKMVESVKLPLDIVDQLFRIRLEVLMQLLRQAREFLEGSNRLSQHGYLFQNRVVRVIEATGRLERLVG